MQAPLLSIQNLTLSYGGTPVVHDVSLDIRDGETLGLIGESGSGKSMTALAVLGLAPGHPRVAGSIRLRGRELTGLDPASWRTVRGRQIGIVFQDPMSALNPLMTLGAQITEAMQAGRGRRERLARAAELLHEVGLPDPARMLDRHPFELSGGQQQRAMIAMVLAGEPALLIADEPTTALDVTTQAQVLALLRDVRRRRGMAMLFISHDLDVVAAMADRIAVMRHGSLLEVGDADAMLHAPRNDYTRSLVAAHTHRALPRCGAARRGNGDIVHAQGLCVDYGRARSRHRVLQDVDLRLREGATLGIAGESGSGKSTLARALLGLVPPAAGSVRVCGMDPADRRQRVRYARACQYIFQDTSGSLNPRRTLLQALSEAQLAAEPATPREALARRCAAMLEEVGLAADMLARFPHQLSGGQRQRVVIARALAMRPRVLVCDEPVSALDATVRNQILDLLARLREAHGLTLLFIGHDLAVMRSLADEILVLKQGQVVEHAATDALFERPRTAYARQLLQASGMAAGGASVPPARLHAPGSAHDTRQAFAPPASVGPALALHL
ncbi:ABC transporter ATP-binding protein [Pigmentiphaga sp. H8]|uniref:nickel ABC transporter ATP-binding protein NikE n=1 Tax=Pigmentiphaga sp. H8 TaxID=2488560 RepID=UPI000F5B7AAF|nr:ABC transporter ATP-binding protein [Pigmentiphaga sp. H8]AZG08398.1 ABC transporter ATP-binding protein [Pigmentiphaga sp. H8]